MKLDLSQFNDIDFENIGSWPKQVKSIFRYFAGSLRICSGIFCGVV